MVAMDALEAVRRAIADAIRSRVAGPDGPERADEIFGTEGPRWFARGRPIREVHGDAAMFIGGVRAILLQSLHPLAMAGVADHSDYRADPWGRLQRTADFLARTTFGTAEQAEAACARVRAVHRHVNGIARDGRPYDASDPHLLLWVHLAEVDSFLATHQRYGERRLSLEECDAYAADMAVVARRLGVPDPPTTMAGVRSGLVAFRPELRATGEARDAARFLLAPPIPLAARAPYGMLALAAVGLLPLWARVALRLPVGPVAETVVVRPAGAAVIHLARWALTPGSARAVGFRRPSPTR
jgi:uncharacterized protein (DUF2236 family)